MMDVMGVTNEWEVIMLTYSVPGTPGMIASKKLNPSPAYT